MKRIPPRLFPRLFPLVIAIAILIAFVQVGVLRLAFDKLGLTSESASLLLAVMLFGSFINLPVFTIKADLTREQEMLRQVFHLPPEAQRLLLPARTIVAVNVGGCLVPVCFSLYLLLHNPVDPWQVLTAVSVVTAITYLASFPVPRVGIVMPIMVAPIAAAVVGLLIDPGHAPTLAYIAGTFGVLIGADVLHLHEVRKLGGPFASIGGAGTFDGIFVTGIIAVLLA